LGTIFQEPSLVEVKVRKMANKYESTIDQLLLAWLMMHPANIYPVIGTGNLDRIKTINKALEIEIELEDWFELFVESQGHKLP
jgi:predicted oxidoreductase